ncbi:hypothetical protein [Paenibacillus polymyxa]|uniref:hypothetical protein n=1 Tax=Paenibacillus polymyxa TaxID=1406 RepID=UPI002ED6AE0B|nr:hypothetical protein [Paenibacillus polymyxa]
MGVIALRGSRPDRRELPRSVCSASLVAASLALLVGAWLLVTSRAKKRTAGAALGVSGDAWGCWGGVGSVVLPPKSILYFHKF